MSSAAHAIKQAKKIVIKLGTNVLTREDGHLDLGRLKSLVSQIVYLKKEGKDILLVTSGAIGAGMAKLGLSEKPRDLVLKQAAAAVGQSALMHYYAMYFKKYGQRVAQILLTQDELLDKSKRQNLMNTLSVILRLHVIPVINENDVISTQELLPTGENKGWLNFSDNDALSAAIARELGAHLLLLLTDIDGIFDRYPLTKKSKLIERANPFDSRLDLLANGKGKSGRGGMLSKIKAARTAAEKGVATIIANGRTPQILSRLLNGKTKCTFFRVQR